MAGNPLSETKNGGKHFMCSPPLQYIAYFTSRIKSMQKFAS